MAVHEIRNPDPIQTPPETPLVRPVEKPVEVLPVTAVRHFRTQWVRKRYSSDKDQNDEGISRQEKTLRDMVGRVNGDFDSHDIPIHLVLHRKGEGYILDVYDCSESNVCALVSDKTITYEKLPLFFKNLQEEAGIIIDTTS